MFYFIGKESFVIEFINEDRLCFKVSMRFFVEVFMVMGFLYFFG